MKSFVALALLGLPLAAQPISFGVKLGTPLNDAFSDTGGKYFFSRGTDRYVIGPTIEIRLPFTGLGVEADALYRRYNIGGPINQFEFPILVKYRFPGLLVVHPFVDAGPSFNYVSDSLTPTDVRHSGTTGIAIGGGLELKALIIRVSPELRYTHWGNQNISLSSRNSGLSSNQNQIQFLVGITF